MDYPSPNYPPPSTDLASILATLTASAPAPTPAPAAVYTPPPSADLASILATLARYTPARTPAPAAVHTPPPPEDGEYDPSTFDPSISSTQFLQPEQLSKPLHCPPPSSIIPNQQQPPQQQQKPPQAVPSSSSITTWPPALRHVIKFIATNEMTMYRIKHLIQTQHEHERQWWQGRASLVTQQAGREEGRRKLNSVSTSVGGRIDSVANKESSESDMRELLLYDRKVHIAYTAMIKSQASELFRLGVPFFNTSPELVVGSEVVGGEDDGKDWGVVRIKENELKKLREKMVTLLEDLCSE